MRLLRFGRAICSHELDRILTGQVGDIVEPVAVTQVRARSITGNPRIELETGETSEPDLVILADGGRGGLSNSIGMDAQLGHLIERPYWDGSMLKHLSAAVHMSGLSVQVWLFCQLIPTSMDLSGP